MFNIFKQKTSVDPNRIPQHIAIIMDGNGRWAKRRGLPREAGHVAGQKALERVIEAAGKLKVKILTVYAFSTENWQRPKKEINALMDLLKQGVKNRLPEMLKNSIKVRALGRIAELPEDVQAAIKATEEATKEGNKLTLNIMLNYGGRAEIVDMVKSISEKVKRAELRVDNINENVVSNNLYTAGIPEPDLLIRTSGEQRVSNYLLWQMAYTEFYFTKVCWPDFGQKCFIEAVLEYQKRKRRKGAVA